MYQFQPHLENSNTNNINNDYYTETIQLPYPLLLKQEQEDLFIRFTREEFLWTSGYYVTPPTASPSSHYSNESYFSPIEQAANFDFFPVVPQQTTPMYDYWHPNQSSPVCSTVNQSLPAYTPPKTNTSIQSSSPTYANNPTPLSSLSTSLCSITSTISSHSVEEKQADSKPYDCKTCPRLFARKHDLQRHNRIHTGEKPYVCTCCNMAFARTDALKRHLRMEEQCRTSNQVQTMKGSGKRRYRKL